MLLTIIIVLAALIGLLVLHEFGHFIIAKKLGVRVEEFGVGYPPRLFGKKFGETLYSINLLPFGAFVKIQGEEEKIEDSRSFSEKTIWQRAMIILGGVITFWVCAFVIFSLVAAVWGLPYAVEDSYPGPAQVQIVQVAGNSPADRAGLKPGDEIQELKVKNEKLKAGKVREVQKFVAGHKGEEISAEIKRGEKTFSVKVVPRASKPGERAVIGVGLARVVKIQAKWYEAPWTGFRVMGEKTVQIPMAVGGLIARAVRGEKVEGVQLSGPIGIANLMSGALEAGADTFLMFLAMIAVWLALFNILPIPALDGGKLLFLVIEAVFRKPVPQKVEQKITAFFFLCLLLIMAFATIKDIMRIL